MLRLSRDFDDSGFHRSDSSGQSSLNASHSQNFGNVLQHLKIHFKNYFSWNGAVGMNHKSISEDETSDNVLPETSSESDRNISTELGACIVQPPMAIDNTFLKIVPRRLWLAQPPIKVEILKKPVPFVIIGETFKW